MCIKYIYFSLQRVNFLSVAHTLIIQKMYTEHVHPLFYITIHEHIYQFECSQSCKALTYVRWELSLRLLITLRVSLGIVPVSRSNKVPTHDFSSVLRQLIFDTRNMLYFGI
jgi:hypothetical protein